MEGAVGRVEVVVLVLEEHLGEGGQPDQVVEHGAAVGVEGGVVVGLVRALFQHVVRLQKKQAIPFTFVFNLYYVTRHARHESLN